MDLHALIASDGRSVARATREADGNWLVTSPLPGPRITCLAADPSRPTHIYAGSRDDGIWRSEDGGATWQRRGLEAVCVTSLAVSPLDPGLVVAGTKPARLHRSTDAGRTWSELKGFRHIPNRWWWFSPAEPPDLRAYVMAIALSPSDPSVIVAGVEFGAVVRSEDGGSTWSRHRRGALRDCHALSFHALDGRYVYQAGGTGGGAALSRDAGREFEKAGNGLSDHYGVACAADPVQPELWYVSVARSPGQAYGQRPTARLFRRTEVGGWKPIGWSHPTLSDTPTALVTRRGRADELIVGTLHGEVWHSGDRGDTWQRLPLRLPGIWHALHVIG